MLKKEINATNNRVKFGGIYRKIDAKSTKKKPFTINGSASIYPCLEDSPCGLHSK